jgi:hypothetical protein
LIAHSVSFCGTQVGRTATDKIEIVCDKLIHLSSKSHCVGFESNLRTAQLIEVRSFRLVFVAAIFEPEYNSTARWDSCSHFEQRAEAALFPRRRMWF